MTSLVFGTLAKFGMVFVEFGLTWWLQSAILLLVGLLAAAWLRHRGPAIESMIYRVTLVAVLGCPLVTQVLSMSGVSLLNIDLQSRLVPISVAEDLLAIKPVTAEASLLAEVSRNVFDPTELDFAAATYQTAGELTGSAGIHEDRAHADAFVAPAVHVDDEASRIEAAPADAPASIHWALAAAQGLLVVWIMGSLGFTAWLLVDLARVEMLRRKSADGDELADQVCRDVAAQLRVRSPQVLSNPFLNSPCLLGHWHPAVLLPEETPATTYHAVFLHELAHLRRGDWLWSLLGRVARALLWCQPLLWIVLHRNSIAAEEVCDDYVLKFGGNREEYLRQLVEIAERTLPRSAVAGVAMVAFRSKLGQRAKRILDTRRVLSTSVGRWFACVALVTTLVGTASVGMIYVGQPRESNAQDVAPSTLDSVTEIDINLSPGSEFDAGKLDVTQAVDPREQTETDTEDDVVEASGTVLGPDGKPIVGAKVYAVNWLWSKRNKKIPYDETVTDADGRFTVSFRKSQVNRNIGQLDQWKNTMVLAKKPGYGPDAVSWRDLEDPTNVNLRLERDDLPITGQILDLEGQPVAGVEVNVLGIFKLKNNDLSPWIEAKKNGETSAQASRHIDESIPEIDDRPVLKTDAQGRFQLKGIGRERIARLVLEGPTIARTKFLVMTRMHEPITRTSGIVMAEVSTTYGAKFRRTVSPTQVIRGVVRDAKTKQPIPGVRMESWIFAGTWTINRVLKTESDTSGKFELVGMPKGDGNVILANPKDGQPYLMREIKVPNKVGLGPVNVDIELHRGVVIRGRVTDKKTGEPVVARFHYLPFLDNKFAQDLPEFDENGNTNGFQTRYESNPDGTYELIGLPGRAIVGVNCIGQPYRRGVGADKIEGANEHGHFLTYNNPIMATLKWPNTLVEIDPAADAKSFDLDVELDPGESITIHTVDELGHPVTGVNASGLTPAGYNGDQDQADFEAVALSPDETRTIILHHEERNIGQVIRAKAGDKTRQVTLEPCATVKGQLVDADGDPMVGISIRVDLLPSGDFSKQLTSITTDSEGRFIKTEMVPGTKYGLYARGPKIGFEAVAKELKVDPGEITDLGTLKFTGEDFVAADKPKVNPRAGAVYDLGDIKDGADLDEPVTSRSAVPRQTAATKKKTTELQPVNTLDQGVLKPDTPPVPKASRLGKEFQSGGKIEKTSRVAVVSDKPDEKQPLIYEGQVLKPDGKPAVGAEIYQVYWYSTPLKRVPAKPVAKTDSNGRFRFENHDGITSESASGEIVAKLKGYGIAWAFPAALESTGRLEAKFKVRGLYIKAKPLIDADKGPLRLVADDVEIQGRIVDLEGKGIAGATVTVMGISTDEDRTLDAWEKLASAPNSDVVRLHSYLRRELRGPHVPSLFPEITTDAEGRFRLRGIGKNRLVKLVIRGKNIEAFTAFARTTDGATLAIPRQHGILTRKLTYYGKQFLHVATPSKPVTGMITDKMTGKPIAGAVLTSRETFIHRGPNTRSERAGSDEVVAISDARGKFRLDGLPRSAENWVQVTIPGQDYLGTAIQVDTSGNNVDPVEKDIALAKGVVVEGRVTDAKAGTGVRGSFRFLPAPKKTRTGRMGIQEKLGRSSSDGKFHILVPAEKGNLCFTAFDRKLYAFKPAPAAEQGAIMFFQVGGEYHAVAEVTPTAGEPLKLDLRVEPLSFINGRGVDPGGTPLANVIYVGETNQYPRWTPSPTGQIKVYDYTEAKPRRLMVVHVGRKLAGKLILQGKDPKTFIVKLQPYATLKGKVVGPDGEPLANVMLQASDGEPPRPLASPSMMTAADFPLPLPPQSELFGTRHLTDEDGNFEISGFVAGHTYHILGRHHPHGLFDVVQNVIAKNVVLKPSESRDLGTIVLKP